MKKFFGTLVLSLFLIMPSHSDDIRDFEIEGMSIGDSALDYFTNNEFKNAIDESAKDRKYIVKSFINKELSLYEVIQISYKNSDKNKIIVGISGLIDFPDNINSCKSEMYKISRELSKLFPNAIKKDWGKYKMPTNEGHYFPITFDFKNLSRAMVSCFDWKKEIGITDNLKVSLFSADYSEYLQRQN